MFPVSCLTVKETGSESEIEFQDRPVLALSSGVDLNMLIEIPFSLQKMDKDYLPAHLPSPCSDNICVS